MSSEIPDIGYWNYRVLERETDYGETVQAIYEVYYNPDDEPISHTKEPAVPEIDAEFEDCEDLKEILQAMKQAADKPVLEYGNLKGQTS